MPVGELTPLNTVGTYRPPVNRERRALVGVAVAVTFLVVVCLGLITASSGPVELDRAPGSVAELEKMSHNLITKDASAAFKASVLSGKHSALLQTGGVAKTLLAEINSDAQAKDAKNTENEARHVVNRVFSKATLKDLASKKRHAKGVKELKKAAQSVEAKEERAALQTAIHRDQKRAAHYASKVRDIKAAEDKDRKELADLSMKVRKHRHELMSLTRKGRHAIESSAAKQSERALLRSQAARLKKEATKLMAKAKLMAAKQKKTETSLSASAKKMMAENQKLINAYKAGHKKLEADQASAHAVLVKAEKDRKLALVKMHRAGALLREADVDPDTVSKAKAKALDKVKAESGKLTEEAVALLLATKKESAHAYAMQQAAESEDAALQKQLKTVKAAEMSDRILRDPSVLSDPSQLDNPKAQLQSTYKTKEKAALRLAAADRKKAAELLQAAQDASKQEAELKEMNIAPRSGSESLAEMSPAARHERKLAKEEATTVEAAQHMAAQAAEVRARRAQAKMARRLGSEMSRQQALQHDLKSQASALHLADQQAASSQKREAFEEGVAAHLLEQKA
mmetsp:Transcript_7602/g.17458  ORF Transcript_7602/g.17458 Transcript_7602/m.17458 type:complete len:572 (-) Transcript_7602:84-1799(-)|eukprot:CAMPEP_0114557296 /NCGR_PEP_ID=MMETSP0114-20121206/9755_1 /TAXON_ID=31324 /ORGANISM="Goniomonas sp, Strain m" /LENGTH=571 /DNA_ID=CAMNT_0001742575 /DNA_START=35 /DNA_END=1750 /DNA_ORIENTATION=+